MSRAVRPRPLDPTKKLLIVRDPALLDQVAAGDVSGMVGPDQANVAQVR